MLKIKAKRWLFAVGAVTNLLWRSLWKMEPIELFIAAVWFGALAAWLPFILKILLSGVSLLAAVLSFWAVLHLTIGLIKMWRGLRNAGNL